MELTKTTRKLGKCIVVKVMKQMEPKEHRGKGHVADGAH
jgi:hypothetical protein